ncbi:MAG: efflux RND transporter permease subunit, partial [Chloroflexota bacterium]|nr:efflux RND transporter permease subunit [Chloroflexota bacterium]
VRLRDVAEVRLDNAPNATITRVNGRPAIGVEVIKAQGANTVEVVDRVKERLAELRAGGALPAGVDIRSTYDQSIAIEEAISGLIKEGLVGAVFAVLVIFLFLLSVRSTLVAAVSIPTSVLAAFILMSWRGISLNIFTLGALAIAVGRVVDDSIVVLENIFRRLQRGEPIGTAALEGTREVAGAITASTVTTICVFLPIGLVGGVTSQFFLPFALTVAFALAASLLVALTIIPVFARLFIGRARLRPEREGPLERGYLRALRWSLGHRAITLALSALLLGGSLALVPLLGTAFLPASGQKIITIGAEAPAGASQAAANDLAARLEAEVGRGGGLDVYSTTVGASARELAFGDVGATSVSINAIYRDDADVNAEAERLRGATRGLPGAESISIEVVQNGPPGQNRFDVIVTGSDFGQVRDGSNRVLEAVRGVPGLTNVRSDLAAAKPEIRVAVDPNRAAARGLNAAAVAGQARALITGQSVTEVTLDGRRVEVYAAFAGPDGPALEAVRNVTVFGAAGPVRLADVATVERVDGPTQILRVDRERAVTVSGLITGGDLGRITSDARAAIDTLGLPAGVNVEIGGASQLQGEAFRSLGVALLVAILLVYIAMVATFGNLRDPFVILFSLPLALIGAIVALYVTGRALGLPALIGLLLLIGIVVTNAIVLLDRVRQGRERGLDGRAALVEAGGTRLRPILMTAFATILALIPLALGLTEGAIVAAELATVVIGGLLTSTLLTLLVVPIIYSLFDDAGRWFGRRRGRDGGHDEAGEGTNGHGSADDARSAEIPAPALRP